MQQIDYVLLAYSVAALLLGNLTYGFIRRDRRLRRLLSSYQNDN